MQFVTLNNGVKMLVFGFGVYQILSSDAEQAISEALEVGCRHIDAAAAYKNEEVTGEMIAVSETPRDGLLVITKAWIPNADKDAVRATFGRSPEKLGLDTVDFHLIHQLSGDVCGPWRALERLNEESRVCTTGVSNFPNSWLADLITFNRIVPAVNQVEIHPLLQRFVDQEFMADEGVQIKSWTPLAGDRDNPFTNPILPSVVRAHGKPVVQVALRWPTQRGAVVILKSARRDRMEENFDVFDLGLADSNMAVATTLEKDESLPIDHCDPTAVDIFKGMTVE